MLQQVRIGKRAPLEAVTAAFTGCTATGPFRAMPSARARAVATPDGPRMLIAETYRHGMLMELDDAGRP